MNIMDLRFSSVAAGMLRAASPIIREGLEHTINPPGAMMLTGIVVGVSVTAYALSLIIKIYRHGPDTDELPR